MAIEMDAEAIGVFLAEHFPRALGVGFVVEEVTADGVTLGLEATEAHLRPGGTVSGPTLMTLADTAMYLSLLARLGPVAQAVTSSLEIHFLRRPGVGRLRASCELLKVGRRLAVGTVTLTSEGTRGPVGHATVTYALPDGGSNGDATS